LLPGEAVDAHPELLAGLELALELLGALGDLALQVALFDRGHGVAHGLELLVLLPGLVLDFVD